ncbi:MAG: MarR family transcriptional regulator [Rhodobacter sp.]|nr:MarR family transcriptional regulator [Rhodobacter sp.]
MTVRDDTRAVREASIGWWLQRLTGRLDRAMTARLAPFGINLGAFAVMMTVLEHGPLTQTEIGRRFGMAPYAISRAIDALERQGYVTRGAHAGSRRAHSIAATQAGLALAPQLHAIVREVNDALCAPLKEPERTQFAALLAKLLANGPAPDEPC